jgi:hypothetical protein
MRHPIENSPSLDSVAAILYIPEQNMNGGRHDTVIDPSEAAD